MAYQNDKLNTKLPELSMSSQATGQDVYITTTQQINISRRHHLSPLSIPQQSLKDTTDLLTPEFDVADYEMIKQVFDNNFTSTDTNTSNVMEAKEHCTTSTRQSSNLAALRSPECFVPVPDPFTFNPKLLQQLDIELDSSTKYFNFFSDSNSFSTSQSQGHLISSLSTNASNSQTPYTNESVHFMHTLSTNSSLLKTTVDNKRDVHNHHDNHLPLTLDSITYSQNHFTYPHNDLSYNEHVNRDSLDNCTISENCSVNPHGLNIPNVFSNKHPTGIPQSDNSTQLNDIDRVRNRFEIPSSYFTNSQGCLTTSVNCFSNQAVDSRFSQNASDDGGQQTGASQTSNPRNTQNYPLCPLDGLDTPGSFSNVFKNGLLDDSDCVMDDHNHPPPVSKGFFQSSNSSDFPIALFNPSYEAIIQQKYPHVGLNIGTDLSFVDAGKRLQIRSAFIVPFIPFDTIRHNLGISVSPESIEDMQEHNFSSYFEYIFHFLMADAIITLTEHCPFLSGDKSNQELSCHQQPHQQADQSRTNSDDDSEPNDINFPIALGVSSIQFQTISHSVDENYHHDASLPPHQSGSNNQGLSTSVIDSNQTPPIRKVPSMEETGCVHIFHGKEGILVQQMFLTTWNITQKRCREANQNIHPIWAGGFSLFYASFKEEFPVVFEHFKNHCCKDKKDFQEILNTPKTKAEYLLRFSINLYCLRDLAKRTCNLRRPLDTLIVDEHEGRSVLGDIDDDDDGFYGLYPEEIESLPLGVFDSSERTNSSTECCICLENLTEQDMMRTIPCNHNMHQVCLDTWLQGESGCPLCRTSVIEM